MQGGYEKKHILLDPAVPFTGTLFEGGGGAEKEAKRSIVLETVLLLPMQLCCRLTFDRAYVGCWWWCTADKTATDC